MDIPKITLKHFMTFAQKKGIGIRGLWIINSHLKDTTSQYWSWPNKSRIWTRNTSC